MHKPRNDVTPAEAFDPDRLISLAIGWCSSPYLPLAKDALDDEVFLPRNEGQGQCVLCRYFSIQNDNPQHVAGVLKLVLDQVDREAKGTPFPHACPWFADRGGRHFGEE